MSEETLTSTVEETVTEVSDFDDAYSSAVAEVGGVEVSDTQAPSAPDAGKAEPEWVAWAKSVNGNTLPDGNINTDAVLRQAYELNRQNQSQAQQIAQVRQLLSDPKIYEAVRTAIQGQPAQPHKPAEDSKTEKTDEEVFKDLVLGAVQPVIQAELQKFQPFQQQAQQLFQMHLHTVKEGTYSQLESEYQGDVQFSQVEPYLVQTLANEAAQFRMHPSAYIDALAANGQLYPKLKFIGDAVSYQLLKSKPAAPTPAPTPAAPAQPQRNAQLSRPGTPSQQVKQGDSSIDDLEDAWANAKRELQQKR